MTDLRRIGPRSSPASPSDDPPTPPNDEQAAWQEFSQAGTAEGFCRGWLAVQCRIVPAVRAGAVFGNPAGVGSFSPIASWPPGNRNIKRLAEVAERALGERRSVVVLNTEINDDQGPVRGRYIVGCPVLANGVLTAAVTLDLAPRSQAEAESALRQLAWGAAWLELLAHRQAPAGQSVMSRDRSQTVLNLLASALGRARFIDGATQFVTAVAMRLGCERVSIGFIARGRVRVRAISHIASFARHTNLVRAIEAAMDEAIDQGASVLHPADATPARITRAHQELALQQSAGTVCTVPFAEEGRLVGALTLERSGTRPFDGATIELCESVAAVAGPVLEMLRRDDRWLGTKAIAAARRHIRHLIGPRHVAFKLTVLGVAAAVLLLAFATGDYRVGSRAVMEAGNRRVAVAPVNGYIREAPARPGDVVKKGQLLALLDDRELGLERARWASQQEQFLRQRNQALALGNAAQINIAAAQIEQARAQLALIDDRLSKLRVVAGFDGVVVTGDLSQSLGSPVEKGQVLFEVAPLEAYRVVLEVDERDIADVAVGQRGRLLLAAAPSAPVAFTVSRITPVSTARDGRNYFRVEARPEQTLERWRPGLEGVGKIDIDRRRLVWIWARPVVDWARLALWTWL